MLKKDDKDPWIYKVKGDGLIAAVGSIGLIDIWDFDQGADHI